MHTKMMIQPLLLAVAFATLPAATFAQSKATTAPSQASKAAKASAAPQAATMPRVLVHKSAACGCCESWVEHLRRAGFTVEVHNTDDLGPVKARLGVPYGKGSCHTAEVAGYFIEGHVPAGDIKRLLAQRPAAKGLVLPGMPAGSPGMEMPDGKSVSYTVELVTPDGSVRTFAAHGKTES